MRIGAHRAVEVAEIVKRSEKVATLFFRDELSSEAVPGQFVMVWVPGVDEIPLSLSHIGELCGVTVKAVGDATSALLQLKRGSLLGIKGPFGRGFSTSAKSALLVAGGIGIACLAPLARALKRSSEKVVLLYGAKTAQDLVLADELVEELGRSCVELVTEDGSAGRRGLVTDFLSQALDEHKPDAVYTCGPEEMMYKVVCTCLERGVWVEASLERWMKCGMGICGHCVLDNAGLLVCRDGPVFSGQQLLSITDFGKACRGPSGEKKSLG